jgi:signal transduction histidine kinase
VWHRPHWRNRVIPEDDPKIVISDGGSAAGPGYVGLTVPERLSALRARARAIPAGRVDALLAVLALLGTLIEAAFADASGGARLAALGPGALVAAGLLLRRREPVVAVALGVAGLAIINTLAHPVWDALNTPFFAVLLLVYSMAAREDGRRLLVGVALSFAGVVLVTATEPERDAAFVAQLLIGTGVFVVAPVYAGRLLHSRLRLNDALTAKAQSAEAERSEGAQEAAAAERARIASELHDLVAHALGAMTIQASAARRLAEVDADRAAEAFAAVEATGRDALGELRTLLEVLRDDESEPLHAPQPKLDGLPALAERARGFGLGVKISVEGERPDDLPASVDLTGYRVVQDALRAARNEGGAGSAEVTVRYRGDRVEVEIADDGVLAGDRRLLGLRERVRLYGGEVAIGARGADGHSVRASLPLDPVPA